MEEDETEEEEKSLFPLLPSGRPLVHMTVLVLTPTDLLSTTAYKCYETTGYKSRDSRQISPEKWTGQRAVFVVEHVVILAVFSQDILFRVLHFAHHPSATVHYNQKHQVQLHNIQQGCHVAVLLSL